MMKKVGIIKRLFALLLVFLLSINSFAAVVSDNDGSAFITKAEFDALKKSFNSQIQNYNDSIDRKIDGAIAQYLSGIQLSKEKKYKVYGPEWYEAGHIFKGKSSRFIRLRNVTSSAFGDNGSKLLVENTTRNNNYGIGYCWWVVGYHPDGYAKTMSDEADAFVAYATNTSWSADVYNTSETSKTTTGDYNFKWVANKNLSLKFNSIISPKKPEIKLIDFLDDGPVTINFYYAKDGKQTEGGTKGGNGGDSGYLAGGTLLSLHHINSYTDYTYLEDAWISISFNASAGDYLCLRNCGGANTVGRYGLFFWDADIPNWELV